MRYGYLCCAMGLCLLWAVGCSSKVTGENASIRGASSGLAAAPARAIGVMPAGTQRSEAPSAPSEKEPNEEPVDAGEALPEDPTQL